MTNIIKKYNEGSSSECKVLKGVSLQIEKGELVAIKGKSGAGKSTLLHIIGCLDECTDGNYNIDGIDIGHLSDGDIAKLRNEKFGFILQDFGLINDDSVLQNVMLPMMFNKIKLREIKDKAVKYLKLFDIDGLMNQKVSTLSGGEKQRVAVARALVNDPEYILADEPTGSLDSTNSEMLMDELIRLHKKGKTVVIITHDDAVANKCQRIINIKDGLVI